MPLPATGVSVGIICIAQPPLLRLGVWEALKLPQRVRSEPGLQTFLMRYEVKMKSLAMMVLNRLSRLPPTLSTASVALGRPTSTKSAPHCHPFLVTPVRVQLSMVTSLCLRVRRRLLAEVSISLHRLFGTHYRNNCICLPLVEIN